MQGSKMNSKLEKQFIDSWYLKTQEFRHALIKRLGKHILFLCSSCWFHSYIDWSFRSSGKRVVSPGFTSLYFNSMGRVKDFVSASPAKILYCLLL